MKGLFQCPPWAKSFCPFRACCFKEFLGLQGVLLLELLGRPYLNRMRKIFYLAEISDNQDAVIYQQEESYGEQQTLQTEAVALMPGFFQKETDGDRNGIYPMA